MKIGNFACIKIRVLVQMALYALMIVIFKVYIFSRIFKKRELSENIYNAKNSTFTVKNIYILLDIPITH